MGSKIGLGGRGSGLADLVASMDDVIIPAICDVCQDRIDKKAIKNLSAHSQKREDASHWEKMRCERIAPRTLQSLRFAVFHSSV